MSEKDCMQLALETAEEIKARQPHMAAGQFGGRLKDVLAWLRSQNIPWAKILAALPQIIAALSAGDWLAVVMTIAAIFGLSVDTAPPA